MIRFPIALFVLSAAVCAQKDSGVIEWWHQDWDAGLEEAARRNVPLLVSFILDGEEANERIVSDLYKDSGFIKATRMAIPIIASMAIHKPKEQFIRGASRSVCSRFGSVKCSVHKNQEMEARSACWPKGLVRTPTHVVLLPDGTEVGRLIDDHAPTAHIGLLEKARRKLGRGLRAKEYDQAKKLHKSIRASLLEHHLGAAVTSLKELEKLVRGTPMTKTAQELRMLVEAMGRGAVSEAEKLAQAGRYFEALQLLSGSIKALKGTPVARELMKLERKLKSSREGRNAAREIKNEKRAQPSWEAAKKREREKDFVGAVKAYYRVVGLARNSPLGKRARERIDALAKDSDLVTILGTEIAEQEARLLYQEASRLRRTRRKKEATALLKELVAKWPGTAAAAKARKQLGGDG